MNAELVLKTYFGKEANSICPYGNGHINTTFLVETDKGNLILQKINTNVFKEPIPLMENFDRVTSYLGNIIKSEGGDPARETLSVIKTVDGDNACVTDDGEYWRLMPFITDSLCYDRVETEEQFYNCALAFGDFQYKLKDFPAELLHETIPNFHNTKIRYENLMRAVASDPKGRVSSVLEEIEFAKARKEFTEKFETARAEGRLPLKVTHNDTKLNNILFDKDSGKALCVIDLDTIMPGYSVNDFGDSIRFGATTAAEDETDLSKVNFDISLFELYTKGFIEGSRYSLSDGELDCLAESAIMMTLECGMRFLTDYIEGDTYFRISRPSHNLDRARNQFKLVRDMEASLDEMKKIVNKYSR